MDERIKEVKVKFKKLHPDAVIPKYAKTGDAGLDITAIDSGENFYNEETGVDYLEYKTGLAFEIPEGYVGLIFPRSSISNVSQMLTNSVGVLDSSYRGEIKFRFRCADYSGRETYQAYEKGERIGQLIVIPYPQIELEEVTELSDSERGTGGFGSSGQ